MTERASTPHTEAATSATFWSALEILGRYSAQFVVTLILARLLQPADFGLIAMLTVFTSIGALLVDGGFSVALIQGSHNTADDETTVFAFSTTIGIAMACALALAAPAIASFYEEPALVPLVYLMIWVLPLGAICAVPDALLTKRLDFRARARAEIVATVVSAVVAITLALKGFGVVSIAWQAIIAIALRALLLFRYSAWRPRGRFRSASLRRLFGFGGYMLLAGVLDAISVRLQSLLVGKLFDATQLGYYALAQNTQQAPTSFIGGILTRVGLPVFSRVADQPQKLLGALRVSLSCALFVFIPCMVGIALVAKPLVELLYGPRWDAAAPILTLLALSAALWPMHVLNLAALSALGRSDLYFRLELVKKIIAVILIISSAPFGAVAVAASVLAASVFAVAINTWYSKSLLGYGMLAQLSDQRGTLTLALVSAACGWSVLHFNPPSLRATAFSILLAATIYLGGAFAFRNQGLRELIVLIRGILAANVRPSAIDAP